MTIAICDCYCRRCLLHDDCGGCTHINDEDTFRAVHPITNTDDEANLAAAATRKDLP
jgi:hypothetical protein